MSQSTADSADATTGSPPPRRVSWNLASQLATHFVYLTRTTAITWWQHAPWLVGFMLFAMFGRYSSMLVTAQVAIKYPFFVIFGMALGLMVNLVMIILAIRSMSDILGADKQPNIRQLLETTVVPFLLIYLTFGYMSSYMSTLLFVIQAQSKFSALSEMMVALNPTQSVKALVTTVVIFLVSFLIGYLVSWLQRKTAQAWLSLVSAFLSALRWVLGFYSIFRIWEAVRIWLYGRQLTLWWQQFTDWLSSWLHFNVPTTLADTWGLFTSNIWPGLWDLLAYPLVWFALVIVVAGRDLLNANTIYERVMRPEGTSVIRHYVLDNALDGLNNRLLPIFDALRDMVKATVPFLGAYVICFTLLTWLGDGLEHLIWMGIGQRSDAATVALFPLVNAVSSVLIMSVKIALLVATYRQATTLAQLPPPRPRTAIAHGLVVALIAIVLAMAQAGMSAATSVTVRPASPQGICDIQGGQVTVSDIRVATELAVGLNLDTTDGRFVAITLTAYSDKQALGFRAALIASGHTYTPYDRSSWITTVPGYLVSTDYVFEANAADLQNTVFAEVRPVVGVTTQIEVCRIKLDVLALTAPSQGSSITADTSTRKSLP